MKKYYFTMIVYVDSDELLNRSLKSIYSVSKEYWTKTKLVVVDSVCSVKSKEVVDRWKRKVGEEDVVYIETQDKSISEAYNIAIPEIRGTYVNFSLASTWFDPNALEAVEYIAEMRERPKLISLSPWTVNEKNEFVKYLMSPENTEDVMYENIRFYRKPEKLQLMFHAYFIRTFLIKSENRSMYFRPELQGDAVIEMLMNLLAEWRGYVFIPKLIFHYTVQLEDNTSAFLDQHYEWWYNDSLNNWILPFVKKWSERSCPLELSMRNAVLYYIFARYNCNYNDRNKGVLSGEKLKEFVNLTGHVLQYINNDLIFRNGQRNFNIPRTIRIFLLKIKAVVAGSIPEIVVLNKQLCYWSHPSGDITDHTLNKFKFAFLPDKNVFLENEKELAYNLSLVTVERKDRQVPQMNIAYQNEMLIPLCKIGTEHVNIKAINYEGGMLEIEGSLSIGDFLDKDQISLKLYRDEKVIPVEYSEIYGLNKLFGITYNHKYQFRVSVPATPIYNKSELYFALDINGEEYPIQIQASGVYAHVREDVFGQYWKYDDNWCLNIVKRGKIVIRRLSEGLLNTKEKEFRSELSKRSRNGDVYAEQALKLRKMYFDLQSTYKNRRIWITFDKLYKAGDNGEYIYNYISKQNDGIEIFYLIKKDSPDYERMKEKGDNLLVWGEDDSLVTILFAEAILTTHTNVISYCGFDKPIIPYICDLFNTINICIQHGLTTQNIAQFQNRLFDNLKLYICASPNEICNLSRPIYGYNTDSLKLKGIARYDGLKSNDKRQILITPTWRRNIANSNIAHFKKGHNDYFKNSSYFRIYNKLINDEKLIDSAKRYGYKVIYLLHPAASAQIDDFERNDYVQLIPAASDMNYEKILTESSLMVTDYSGVQFDFAYMRKPILYYHPKDLPPHYSESEAYKYDRDSFGPVIDNHTDLVNSLCEYMKNGCTTKAEYIQRADKFFAFNDHNNCERIYNTILEFINETIDHK